ncbi:MAG: hypothetical protein AABX19_01115 [Nanoarchaeota archaeon]
MATDIVLIEKNNEIEKFAKTLGYSKIFFKDEIEKLNMKEAKDYTEARRLVENKSVKILLNPHTFGKRDNYTADRPGLDHILASMANKNDIKIAFSLNKINNLVEMNWVMQSIMLCRKYKVRMLFFTMADNEYKLVSRIDFISLLKILGMTGGEAKKALELQILEIKT